MKKRGIPQSAQANEHEDKKPALGEQELEILRFVQDFSQTKGPVSVREAFEQWAVPRGKARTTVLTMMERLREKGFLERTRSNDGATFVYAPVLAKQELMQGLVQEFVQKTLGGSLSPFVAYLANGPELSEGEMDELRRLVAELPAHGTDSSQNRNTDKAK